MQRVEDHQLSQSKRILARELLSLLLIRLLLLLGERGECILSHSSRISHERIGRPSRIATCLHHSERVLSRHHLLLHHRCSLELLLLGHHRSHLLLHHGLLLMAHRVRDELRLLRLLLLLYWLCLGTERIEGRRLRLRSLRLWLGKRRSNFIELEYVELCRRRLIVGSATGK